VPATGLGIGIACYLIEQAMKRIPPSFFSPRWKIPAVWEYGFCATWTVLALIVTGWQYVHLCAAVRAGKFSLVEGKVEHFIPMPYSGHAQESFEVGGYRYRYSDYQVSAAFNNTASHGGPIHDGVQVRIYDVNGEIAHLEVAR